jgi:hypothetical protein
MTDYGHSAHVIHLYLTSLANAERKRDRRPFTGMPSPVPGQYGRRIYRPFEPHSQSTGCEPLLCMSTSVGTFILMIIDAHNTIYGTVLTRAISIIFMLEAVKHTAVYMDQVKDGKRTDNMPSISIMIKDSRVGCFLHRVSLLGFAFATLTVAAGRHAIQHHNRVDLHLNVCRFNIVLYLPPSLD